MDGQKKKIGKANERKGKVKRGKDDKVNRQGGKRGAPAPHGAKHVMIKMLLDTLHCQGEKHFTDVDVLI